MNMNFNQLKSFGIVKCFGPSSQTVTGLMFHSKNIQEGSIFFCINGENSDGHLYAEEAIKRGASTIIGEQERELEKWSKRYPACSFLLVQNVRRTMAYLAKHFYNCADEKLKTIGVTGTNGKTTVSSYVRCLLNLLKMPTGLIGTTGIWTSKEKVSYKKSTPTTPEAIDLHHIFHMLERQGDQAVSMEVSSIALDQLRAEGIYYDVAIHTNFSEEHLEYHRTMDHYKNCKLKLFKQAKCAVVNIDDEGMAEDILDIFDGPLITYSLKESSDADLKASGVTVSEKGTSFTLDFLGERYQVFVPVFGNYNIANVLSAVGTAILLGHPVKHIIDVLPELQSPEGRFQVIEAPNNAKIILDYAHTPVALNRLVEEVKKLNYNRLIVMIAGIGIRDFNKMPKMAATIDGQADEVIVTVDHPGYHDPQVIIDQVMKGFKDPKAPNIHSALTRKDGVLKALLLAEERDIILLTSGCINNAQIVKGKEIPHSDEEIIHGHYLQSS
ncbi:UDP-N-acetylmuramoyl-L-alanyl-D-glutamate--2,6-diaminopimelate ligase [Halobacillus sp. Marseille-Q1614]|uniref:UDP-N-acetylmuramoyl-L-alanyl-D-glutamate--2, 6-diaminopimelate ligase n=1 Tax=Halobacillus sp. Marseille-Q1614 TaxID=2709134 RepID=UPI0015705B97|nr:UDP-N-acetylmuramoyl-L-alanyl-D-glutamate--2,6-diaminopimelate ligase [Halobacillus sp. Marseille-Q1614]